MFEFGGEIIIYPRSYVDLVVGLSTQGRDPFVKVSKVVCLVVGDLSTRSVCRLDRSDPETESTISSVVYVGEE